MGGILYPSALEKKRAPGLVPWGLGGTMGVLLLLQKLHGGLGLLGRLGHVAGLASRLGILHENASLGDLRCTGCGPGGRRILAARRVGLAGRPGRIGLLAPRGVGLTAHSPSQRTRRVGLLAPRGVGLTARAGRVGILTARSTGLTAHAGRVGILTAGGIGLLAPRGVGLTPSAGEGARGLAFVGLGALLLQHVLGRLHLRRAIRRLNDDRCDEIGRAS